MKISNKEKIMLFILGIIVIAFGYYNYIYLIQTNTIEEKLKEEMEVKQKYETAKATIDSIEDKKYDANLLKVKVEDETKPFYPIINEEHIILELDKLLKDNELDGKISFEPIVSDSVEKADKTSQTLAESSLQSIVDKYNNRNSEDSNSKPANSSDKSNIANNSEVNNKNNFNTDQAKEKKKDTLQYVKIQVTFEGSYDGVYKMLTTIKENERKIVVNSIKLSSDTTKGIKGILNLEIYSVPKINNEIEDYLKWDFNNNYGKDVPFAAEKEGSLSNTAITTSSKSEEVTRTNDFIASVKSVTSDLPKIMLGKANDDMRTSYVYGNSNSEEPVEMILTQDGENYYYKYKTSKQSFPANYDGLGEEFVPKSKDIVLKILSENKLSGTDNSKMRLTILNKTDKDVQVNISGDDSRATIDANESNVKINKS
ncbi:pilus assembly protein PilO [Clostridium beijerinckii]|nr:pilus assembly protein PilO [Clostridium beijerinckii]